jgi:hypothetical protein
MAELTRSAANKYFKRFSPEVQAEIEASWGGQDLLMDWFKNAVDAGAVGASGGMKDRKKAPTEGHSSGEGYGANDPTGIRAHAKEHGMSEDFDRFDNATLKEWEQFRDSNCPPKYPYRMDPGHINKWFKGQYQQGACVEKPIDTGGVIQDQSGKWGPNGQTGKGQADPQSGKPAEPEPTTFGQQLSYTGDPMQDMLIYQFNTKAQLQGDGKNIFGLGEDRQVGGEGAAADMQKVMAQSLAGGGLWWGAEGFNEGFRADQKNAVDPATGKKKRGRGGMAPSPAEIAAPPQVAEMQQGLQQPPSQAQAPTPAIPEYKQQQPLVGGGMQHMLKNRGFGGALPI